MGQPPVLKFRTYTPSYLLAVGMTCGTSPSLRVVGLNETQPVPQTTRHRWSEGLLQRFGRQNFKLRQVEWYVWRAVYLQN